MGKIVKINLNKYLKFESIEVHYYLTDEYYSLNIIEEYDIGIHNDEKIIISSEMPINWIKIYECTFEEKKKDLVKGEIVATHNLLRPGEAIVINSYLSCGIPSYIVEFERHDYLKGSLYLAENGKNGILDNQVSLCHTWKSYLYYLLE